MAGFEKEKKQIVKIIKGSDEFKAYVAAKEAAKADIDLWRQINAYRNQRTELYARSNGDEIYEKTDSFESSYAFLYANPVAKAYLDAELAVCRMVQELGFAVVEALGFE
ncbi:MAG: YlbF family regulator [Lachnospiraceae bacterium]|nr:YlbF family regulator [Lachnospiraceae bacterium]